MIFGFLFVDILLWAVIPFFILCLLWGDKKAWAGAVTVGLIAILAGHIGFGTVLSNITDPLILSTFLRDVVLYAVAGLGFSFLKWWVLTTKAAREFAQFLSGRTFTVDEARIRSDIQRSIQRGGVDHFGAGKSEDSIVAEATAKTVQDLREVAASNWNGSYNNTYRKVLSVIAKNPSGWETKYQKWTLSEYVTSWAVYWPFYMLLLVLDDLIRHVIDWFVNVFGKGFQRIANAAFSNIQ